MLSLYALRVVLLCFRLNIGHHVCCKAYHGCGRDALQQVKTRAISSALCRGIGHHAHKNLWVFWSHSQETCMRTAVSVVVVPPLLCWVHPAARNQPFTAQMLKRRTPRRLAQNSHVRSKRAQRTSTLWIAL